jgi:branched-chain amino acid transport system substrate-binding protein
MRLRTCRALAACFVALGALAVAACGRSGAGGGAASASTRAVKVVDIYSSLPMRGPSAGDATAVEKGIELALAQAGGRAGQFTVRYTLLDDSTGVGGWSPSQTATNARRAAADRSTVLYIGEFDDEASEVSLPILNEAGIPEVSPSNTNVGLTTGESGNGSARVPRYAPAGTRTYLRIVPSDAVQAAADLLAMQQARCTRVALADDGEDYGIGLANLVEAERHAYAVKLVNTVPLELRGSVRRWAIAVKAAQPDCVLLSGITSTASVQATRILHGALPRARIFAPDRMCTSGWTNPGDGGVPANVDPLIECTSVILSLNAYPGARAFLAAYQARYAGSEPSPYAILGYEAMSLGLSTIAHLGPYGTSKSAMLSALFSTRDRHSVLGTYGFQRDGDTTLRSYGLYKVGANGNPTFVRVLDPPRVL